MTGKPVEMYGLPGREEATGRGVGIFAVKLLSRLGRKPAETPRGHAGIWQRRLARGQVSCARPISRSWPSAMSAAATTAPRDSTAGTCLRYAREHRGSLAGYNEADQITNEQLLELDVELLVPAALGGVITEENAAADQGADHHRSGQRPDLARRRRDPRRAGHRSILPDILANAGGVTASYFEWVQNRQHYQWGINRVRQELDRVLTEAFERVWELSVERKVCLRTAAYMLGIGRVGRATILGGIT